ncbi:MAG: PilZ domain-containing protein [Planctomycetes bacterium]|nr:PilZ domain-containing protein [Planctomycetota bacterium]
MSSLLNFVTVICQGSDDERVPQPSASGSGRHDLHVVDVMSAGEIGPAVAKAKQAVLLLYGLKEDAAQALRALRADKAHANLPAFVAVPGTEIDERLLKHAEELKFDLLPLPMPAAPFWAMLREAGRRHKAGVALPRVNRRRHYRARLSVQAFCLIESQTVDIGAGGIHIQSNHAYAVGESTYIDVPALRETLGGPVEVKVVKVEALKGGGFKYGIRAQFVNLAPQIAERLARALSVLER